MGFALYADRADLTEALAQLQRFIGPQNKAEAILSLADRMLSIALGGIAVKVRAEGDWPGEVRVAALSLLSLAEALPVGDPLPVRAEDELFTVGEAMCPLQKGL